MSGLPPKAERIYGLFRGSSRFYSKENLGRMFGLEPETVRVYLTLLRQHYGEAIIDKPNPRRPRGPHLFGLSRTPKDAEDRQTKNRRIIRGVEASTYAISQPATHRDQLDTPELADARETSAQHQEVDGATRESLEQLQQTWNARRA